jgi:TRAP-type C4-dicarboxylate transport system substrate-binding protein
MIKSFQTLSPDEQDSLLEILRNYQAKRREAEILANVRELKEAIALGTGELPTLV